MNLKIKRMRELAGFFAQTVRTDGFGPTLKRSAAFLKRRFGSKKGRFLPQKETLAAQRALDYGALGWPAVSICVPLYNTPQKYLRQLLDSVLGQTCPNWQLCLADASDAAHGRPLQTGFCAGLPQLLQLHLPFFRVPKGSVRRCGRVGPCL